MTAAAARAPTALRAFPFGGHDFSIFSKISEVPTAMAKK